MDLNFNSCFWISTRAFKLSTRNSELVTCVLRYHLISLWNKEFSLKFGKWLTLFLCTKIVNNYLIIIDLSLLPICSKIFEKLLFDSIYEFLDRNSLLNSNQSGFRPNDSSIHQLIAITHDIFTAFDANPSLIVRDAFLDLSKTLHGVGHKGLLHKLKCNGINGPFLVF